MYDACRAKGTAAKGGVADAASGAAAEEIDSFFAETQANSQQQSGNAAAARESQGVNSAALDDKTEWIGEDDGEDVDTADGLIAGRSAGEQSAKLSAKTAPKGTAAGGGRINVEKLASAESAKRGRGAARIGGRKNPTAVATSAELAGDELWARDSGGDSSAGGGAAAAGGEGGALLDTWSEKHKEAMQ